MLSHNAAASGRGTYVGCALALACTAAVALACPYHELGTVVKSAPGAIPTPVQVGGDPADVGQWLPPQPWPVIAIHMAMLPTGEVLAYSYPDGTQGSNAYTWDPETGVFTDVEGMTDIFCSGLALLESGLVYTAGGNDTNCSFQGRRDTYTFDPWTHTWTQLGDMATGRWYPNVVMLGDGRLVITSGLNRQCVLTDVMETYTPGVGLSTVPSGARFMDLFPRTHLLSSGRLAHAGSETDSQTFDPASGQWQYFDNTNFGYRDQNTTVLVPGLVDEIMTIGGYINGTPTTSCERANFNDDETGWYITGSMNMGRAHANAVILPDRNVMIIGGGSFDLYGGPVFNAELYDPDTETWTLLPMQQWGRMYHSTAVLLPDGRVVSAGQDFGPGAYTAEIYEPAYLFRGPRPEITAAPATFGYGEEITIDTPQGAEITSVALMRLGTVTHSVNTGQRYVGLPIVSQDSDSVTVSTPANGNLAPPGHYMLFILNSSDVPSVAPIVQLTQESGAIACADIVNLRARCQNGTLRVRVTLTDTSHDGETVTVDVNGTPHDLTIVSNRAALVLPGVTGPQTVTLTNPASCLPPRNVNCQ